MVNPEQQQNFGINLPVYGSPLGLYMMAQCPEPVKTL
jgi:hypothetical protein